MKIVHVCTQIPYNDYWGYQENLLPHYHKKLGHDVTVITTNTIQENGIIVDTKPDDYFLNDGVRVIRLVSSKFPISILNRGLSYHNIYPLLKVLQPDFIMLHGISSLTILDAVKFKKDNPNCRMIADSHLDYFNTSFKSKKRKLLRLFVKLMNRVCMPYFLCVYGVTPIRKEYAIKKLGVPRNKCDVLVMGGDDEKIHFDKQDEIRKELRCQHGIKTEDFLIVTGGKIDKQKKIHLLMEAVKRLNNSNIKLVVFGAVYDEIQSTIDQLGQWPSTINIGWIDSDKVYDWFLASDLAVFPGTHSVLWEQAVASGIPCVFKHWDGMEHVDVGGNCNFLYEDSIEEIIAVLKGIINDKEKYQQMKKAAIEKGLKEFSYIEIAKKVISS